MPIEPPSEFAYGSSRIDQGKNHFSEHHGCIGTMILFLSLVLASVFVSLTLVRTRWTNLALFNLIIGTACFSISMECLSLAQAISFPAVRYAVVISIIISSAISFFLFRPLREAPFPDDKKVRGLWKSDLLDSGIIGALFTVLVGGILLIILTATAYTALLSVPNNWDSMTYHLPRIEHWLQDRSLAFYPTYNERQNESGILAEEIILALRSFNHAYPIANLVQWLSFGGCIVIAGRIAGQIGGTRSAQYLASVLVATIPMAILQASSTQTDLVVAFFSATSVYFLLQVRAAAPYSLIYGFVITAALAYSTKGTAAIFLSGFLIIYGLRLILRHAPWKVWLHLFLSGCIGVVVLAGHELRLFHSHGTFIGPSSAATSTVHPNWRSTAFNAVRNFASNLVISNDTRRLKVESSIVALGKMLGIRDTDGHYSWFGMPFHLTHPSILAMHEDYGPNMAHAVLILIVMSMLVILVTVSPGWRRQSSPIMPYAVALIISMVAFCALLKWQPWIVRLQLGEFILAMPVVAIPLSFFAGIATPLLVIFMGWQATHPTFGNVSRPILGNHPIAKRAPVDILFTDRLDLEADYMRVADAIAARRPKQVGIIIGGDSWEFPLWYLLRQRLSPAEMPAIVYEMNDKNVDPRTDIVVCLDIYPTLKNMREIPGFGQLRLYERQY